MWRNDNGDIVKILPSRMEIIRDGKREIVSLLTTRSTRTNLSEALHAMGFRKVS